MIVRAPVAAALMLTPLSPLSCAPAGAQTAPPPTSRASRPASARVESLNPRPKFDYFDGLDLDPAIPTPASVLGYEIGDRFTRHADVVHYLRAVADASGRVTMHTYGTTNEGRALTYLVIASPDNLRRLDTLRERNLALADPRGTSDADARRIIDDNPAFVWLSYNVHGNEASSSEAAMQVVYTMAAARNAEVRDILDKVVLVVDPMLNPDGRDRYVNWYTQTLGVGLGANPDRRAAEHDEPWPGGRTNHYYFDLNRDWLWLSQVESRQRLPVYRSFLPQLHIDYHEQGHRSPYFFGAGDEPYNTNIPDETRAWINRYGEANAKVFDDRGLVYSTRERFDYLYPGYGKVLPVYHGAVGLLCEQAGHGFAGLAVEVVGDYTLALRHRAQHHFLTSLSYLETTAAHRRGQLERFRRFFVESAQGPDAGPAAFYIHPDNHPALLEKVWDLCSAHGIEIETLTRDADAPGQTLYATGAAPDDDTLPAGTWVIRAAQPMGRLARAVFEPDPEVTDIDTYDITAWSLPVSFGLRAAFADAAPADLPTRRLTEFAPPAPRLTGSGGVALVIDSRQHFFPRAVGLAVAHDLVARFTGDTITTPDGASFGPGSLILHTIRNHPRALNAFVRDCLGAGVSVHRAATGLTTAGHVLGANDNGLADLPRVLLLRGEPTFSNAAGSTWWLLDREQRIPYTAVNADALTEDTLDDSNVLVVPEMFGSLDERATSAVKDWVRAGGTLVAIGGASNWAARAVLELKPDEHDDDDRPTPNTRTYAQREQDSIEGRVPGALLRARIDATHPLAAGAGEWIGVLKRSTRTLQMTDDAYVVARFADITAGEPLRIGGTISQRNAFRIGGTPAVVHHRLGQGAVISFSDDPTFRAFHHAGMRLLMNAVIYGPSL